MSNSTTLLDQIASNQAAKEVVFNALLDAASPATLWGRHASACSGLTWGYYGGNYVNASAVITAIANGTVTLTASTTNYLFADASTGAISANTTGFPVGKIPLYSIVTGATTVTSYLDYRCYLPSSITPVGVTLASLPDVNVTEGAGIDGFFLKWNNATGKWIAAAGGPSALSGLSDVNVTEGAGINGYSLTWNNATSKWVATNVSGGGSSTFAGLTDVAVSGPSNNQVPAYNSTSSKWANQTLSLAPLGNDWLNPADCSSKITLSNANLTATLNAAPASYSLVRGNVSHNSGKWYFEFTCPVTLTTLQGAGVATTADPVDTSSFIGLNDTTGAILRSDGFVSANGTSTGSIAQSSGAKVMCAVDIGAGLIWYRIANGNWNNSGTANPATGVGGVTITAGLTYFPVLNFSSSSTTGANGAMTLNVGASAFANTPPTSGFSPWNASDNTGLQPSDVGVSSPSVGQVLTWNGSAWINQTPSGGGGSSAADVVSYTFFGGL